MRDDITKKISQLLLNGKNKREVYDQLKGDEDGLRLSYLINNEAELVDRKKYQYLCLGTALILCWLTVIKVLDAMALGRLDLYWLASLVVPMIHVYVLRKMLRFQRTGYQFLFVLGILALFRPENRVMPELMLVLSLILLSGFLYLKLFPKEKTINKDT